MIKFQFIKYKEEETKILFVYRYISLLITSVFYLLNQPDHSIARKVTIIGCISIAAIILSYLYLMHENDTKVIKKLILVESIGNAFLLVPSGGINSPFIWYTLNTILISSVYFDYKSCLKNLLLYILIIMTIAFIVPGVDIDYVNLLKEHSSLLLSLMIIIASIQVWVIYLKKTKEKSIVLSQSMEHIKSLYQSVNILTNQGNKEGLIKLLFDNIKNLTKSNTVFYYDMTVKPYEMMIEGDESISKHIEEKILLDVENLLNNKAKEVKILDKKYVLKKVQSNYLEYGILGYEVIDEIDGFVGENNLSQIEFLSELISSAFERFYLEEINDRLIVSEEQNRIANEIHDSVLQRLFSISCGIYSLMRNIKKIKPNIMENELNKIRISTDDVMKELREKIYGLSWKKTGQNSFKADINKYIDDIKRFNKVKIPFYILGNDELLSLKQKKAIYRIICESLGNAIRHGRANTVEVSLKIDKCNSSLKISDDGVGFDLNRVSQSKFKGLGIKNMQQLADSLNGEIIISSKKNQGTNVVIDFPTNGMSMKGEESII